jgi:hypothetical protein
VAVLGQYTDTGFQHDWQFPDLDLWETLVNDGVLVRAGPHDILDIHVHCHHRGVCEIAKSRLLREHDLGCAGILVDLGAIQVQIAERNFHFKTVFLYFLVVILVGYDTHRVKHIDRAFQLDINHVVIRLDLMTDQLVQMFSLKI